MDSKKTLNKLLVSAVALTVAGAAGYASAGQLSEAQSPNIIKVGMNGCNGKSDCKGHAESTDGKEKEKCYGVVKAGHNDCANASKTHSCAGQAETDGDTGEWVLIPEGLCDKLVGGSTTPVEAEAQHDEEHHGDDNDTETH